MTVSFEAIADITSPVLCPDCPMRSLCDKVELARIEAGSSADENTAEQLAAVEADAAAELVLTAVYKQKVGCEGAHNHDEACGECGNDKSCSAYTALMNLMSED